MENTLRSKLKHYSGSMKELASRTGFSRQYVRMVLLGKANNLSIIQEAVTLLEEYEALKQHLAEKVQVLQEA